jgi:hypothetical protein
MEFSSPPAAEEVDKVKMTAAEALDAGSPDVDYYFHFVAGGSGGSDSAWQAERGYIDTGLQTNTQYSYEVKARDGVGNETGYSAVYAAFSAAAKPGNPTIVSKTATTMNIQVSGGSNPPYTEVALQCVVTADPDWTGQWVDADGNPSAVAVWQTAAEWGVATAMGLTPDTNYCWRANARNGDGIETAYTGWACGQTEEGLPGDMDCDGEIGFGDINPFVLALSNPTAWQSQYPDCDIMNGDINGDGEFDFKDINPFVLLLSSP